MNRDPHPLAGKTVKLIIKEPGPESTPQNGDLFKIEDWWQNVFGKSWMSSDGNPAALMYAMRSGFSDLPTDNEVVYGKIGAFGFLIHQSELGEEVA